MKTSCVFDKIINQAYGVLIGTKEGGVDMRNFSRLMFLILSLYLGDAFAQHGRAYEEKLAAELNEASKVNLNQFRVLHQGQEFVNEATRFDIGINLKEVDNLFVDFGGASELEELSENQKDLIWLRIAKNLPVNTNFSLGVKKIIQDTGGGSGFFWINIEGVDPFFKIDRGKLVSEFYYNPYISGFVEKSDESFNFEKWDKESGYTATKKHIEKSAIGFVAVKFLLQELVDDNGNVDVDEYAALLDSMGMPTSIARHIVLEDGTRSATRVVNAERLSALYNEPRVLNIVPITAITE